MEAKPSRRPSRRVSISLTSLLGKGPSVPPPPPPPPNAETPTTIESVDDYTLLQPPPPQSSPPKLGAGEDSGVTALATEGLDAGKGDPPVAKSPLPTIESREGDKEAFNNTQRKNGSTPKKNTEKGSVSPGPTESKIDVSLEPQLPASPSVDSLDEDNQMDDPISSDKDTDDEGGQNARADIVTSPLQLDNGFVVNCVEISQIQERPRTESNSKLASPKEGGTEAISNGRSPAKEDTNEPKPSKVGRLEKNSASSSAVERILKNRKKRLSVGENDATEGSGAQSSESAPVPSAVFASTPTGRKLLDYPRSYSSPIVMAAMRRSEQFIATLNSMSLDEEIARTGEKRLQRSLPPKELEREVDRILKNRAKRHTETTASEHEVFNRSYSQHSSVNVYDQEFKSSEWGKNDVHYQGARETSRGEGNPDESRQLLGNFDNLYGKSTEEGRVRYQTKRQLPVLGMKPFRDHAAMRSLVDPLLKGTVFRCLTPKSPPSGLWKGAKCTFWLSSDICSLQWYEHATGNSGIIPTEKIIKIEQKKRDKYGRTAISLDLDTIAFSRILELIVVSPNDEIVVIRLAAANEEEKLLWWQGLHYCRSVVSFVVVKRS
jgi:hypothetical protein